ncbi:MAG: GNAT family N-acetyltransferase [Bacteroidia bacterium]
MDLVLLADRPQAIPILAKWYFEEWGHEVHDNSLEKEVSKLEQFLNRDKLPLSVVAMEGNQVVGAAQLKFREMSIYPEKEHWLGAVYVASTHRGKGIAAAIIQKSLSLANQHRITDLYLQTEHLDGGLYKRLGWEPIEQITYEEIEVLVMKKSLSY